MITGIPHNSVQSNTENKTDYLEVPNQIWKKIERNLEKKKCFFYGDWIKPTQRKKWKKKKVDYTRFPPTEIDLSRFQPKKLLPSIS